MKDSTFWGEFSNVNPYDRKHNPSAWREWELTHGIKKYGAKNPFMEGSLSSRRWSIAYFNYHNSKEPKETPTMATKDQLYKHGEQYVKRLATDSKGQAVVEDASTGAIFAVDPSKLEMVVPYTVAVRFNTGSTIYHYLAAEGVVAKGDILLTKAEGPINLATVIEVDTKSLGATAELKSAFIRKLKTEEL